MSRPSQGNTAILLPTWIVGYASLEHGVEDGQKLAADSNEDVHFTFTFSDPTLEVLPIARNHPNGEHGQHPDKPSDMLVTGVAHPWVLQPVVPGLKTLRAPAKMRQELLKRGKSADISNLGNESGQSWSTSEGKTLQTV